MTLDLYRDLVLDHWRNPRHGTPLERPTAVGEIANESCGDSVRVELVIHDNEIRDISVQVSGCALATAAGSLLAERATNQSVGVIQALDESTMIKLLDGAEPSASRRRCATLALEALQAALT